MPTVSELRPARCVCCRVASRPAGGLLAIHGHGLRDRQLRGPTEPGQRTTIIVVQVRRYECLRCAAVMTVTPSAVLPRMLYAATAIALALALYGLDGLSARAVRAAVGAWQVVGASSTGWKSLRRWIAASTALWSCIRESPEGWRVRQLAARAATTLIASAPFSQPSLHAAIVGALHAR